MVIKVLGTGCKKCMQAYQNVQQAVQKLKLEAEILKVDDLTEMVRLGIMSTPALIIDDKVVSVGRVLKAAEVEKLLKNNR